MLLRLHCCGGDGTPSTGSSSTNTWAYDAANRLLSRPGVSYSYDNNGNTVSMTDSTGTITYQYDYENRLVQINTQPVTGNSQLITYKYDPFGRRIEKNVNGVITRYVYDREDILFELDGSGNIITEYVHGPGIDEPIAMIRNNQTYYYHADGLGSIIAITDSSGNVVQRYEYNSFGEITYQQDANFKQPYTYTAREYDEESGLYYYRARYYYPKIGRFISEDPIGLAGGINFYSYVGNNPVNWVDPYGLYVLINPPPPRVPPRQPPPGSPLDALLRCMENCIGTTLIITSTYEDTPEHPSGTPHRRGVGADIRSGGNSEGLLCCASQCGAGFGQDEGNHIHVQIPRGRRGGRGQLPF